MRNYDLKNRSINSVIKAAAAVCFMFGMLTLFVGSSIIFDLFGIRQQEENYVPFIVYANVICSFFYLAAAYGLLKRKKWTTGCLVTALIILAAAFIALIIYIGSGGLYETKTVAAMLFRIGLTAVFTIASRYDTKHNKAENNLQITPDIDT